MAPIFGNKGGINMVKLYEFRKKFFENLESKTGWGKEEIKRLFDETIFELSDSKIEG